MYERAIKIRIAILALLSVCTFVVWFIPVSQSEAGSRYLEVHYLDIGQGDSFLIETPNGRQVLIDGGPNAIVLQRLSEVMDFGDHTIDMVVGTHPDKDHIGGLSDVLKKYDVGTILTTENKNDTQASALYDQLKQKEGADVINARRGQMFILDASTTLRVLFPDRDPTNMESNESSIVLQLRYGSSTFLFTGDSPEKIEHYLVSIEGNGLKSDVLKAGHHGSRTSTSEEYLDAVNPEYAIISAGLNNKYGHPHQEVMDRLKASGTTIYETSKEGTITLLSDGKQVWKE